MADRPGDRVSSDPRPVSLWVQIYDLPGDLSPIDGRYLRPMVLLAERSDLEMTLFGSSFGWSETRLYRERGLRLRKTGVHGVHGPLSASGQGRSIPM